MVVTEQFIIVTEQYTGSDVVTVHRGVQTSDDDGIVDVLGMFTGVEFSVNSGVLEGELEDEIVTSSGLIDVNIQSGSRSYVLGEFDGNFDDTDPICATDRAFIMSRLSLTVDDAEYDARCDFDVDGTIEQSDIVAFNYAALGCSVDYDCSTSIDIDDYTTFQTLYAVSDPLADIDGNGTFNIDDYTEFQTLAAFGC